MALKAFFDNLKGTFQTFFQIGGKNSPGFGEVDAARLAVLEDDGATLANLRGKDPILAQDFLTKNYFDGFLNVPGNVVEATTTVTTVLDTFSLLPGMSITPGAGTYICFFSGVGKVNKKGPEGVFTWTAAGVVTGTERIVGGQADNAGGVSLITSVTVADAEAIEVHWRLNSLTGGPTLTTIGRSLILFKVA